MISTDSKGTRGPRGMRKGVPFSRRSMDCARQEAMQTIT